MNNIIIKIAGGFGNQLFMLFCGLSLGIDNNLEIILDLNSNEKIRKHFTKYTIFNSDELKKIRVKNYSNLNLIKEKNFKYNPIILNNNLSYHLNQNNSGYFQSYKYFWHNRNIIKKYINFNFEKFNYYKNILAKYKNIISVHMRLTDYVKKSDYHYNVNMDYYKDILLKYNLTDYNIMLFSDDTILAKELISKIVDENKILLADDIIKDDEEQFYMMICINIRINPNSTYSLWSCYFNEIFTENNNNTYYFPSKWFAQKGPEYNIYDLIPEDNKNFIIINV